MAKKKTSLVDAAKRLNRDAETGSAAEKSPTGKAAAGKSAGRSATKPGRTKPPQPKKSAPKGGSSTRKPSSDGKTAKSAPAARKAPAKSADSSSGTKSSVPATNLDGGGGADDRATTIAEIVEIAEGLDDAGLALLLKQAQVVRYKGQIEEFNRQLNSAAGRAAQARRDANRPDYVVDIERTPDDFFIIKMDSARIFFNRGELRELTRICHKVANARAGAKRLFRWFEEERSDLLADAGINSDSNPYLTELYELIVATYKVKS